MSKVDGVIFMSSCKWRWLNTKPQNSSQTILCLSTILSPFICSRICSHVLKLNTTICQYAGDWMVCKDKRVHMEVSVLPCYQYHLPTYQVCSPLSTHQTFDLQWFNGSPLETRFFSTNNLSCCKQACIIATQFHRCNCTRKIIKICMIGYRVHALFHKKILSPLVTWKKIWAVVGLSSESNYSIV